MSQTSQPPRRDLWEIEREQPEPPLSGLFYDQIQGGEVTEEIDPTPQDRESVTTGWNPTQDRLDAWKAKWELTR
jgi:hypothetical protein